MKKWVTEFRATEALTGQMKTWCGPHVCALTEELAQQWCDENAGYLKVIGELQGEIPCKAGTYEPDWANQIDYEKINSN